MHLFVYLFLILSSLCIIPIDSSFLVSGDLSFTLLAFTNGNIFYNYEYCGAGKYKDPYFHWQSIFIGTQSCCCNSSHWSEAMYLPKHRSTLELFISNSYDSFSMEAIPILRRGKFEGLGMYCHHMLT